MEPFALPLPPIANTSPAQTSLNSSQSIAPFRASPKSAQTDAENESIRASPKTAQNGEKRASPKKPATPVKSASKVQKLEITESKKNGQESWTVKTGRKASFRVRLADAGFRVNFRFYDDENKQREPYCCYLSATEWRAAKRQTLADFTKEIIKKIEARKGSEAADTAKLDVLIARIQSLIL